VRDLTVRFCSERLRDGHADLIADLAWELPVLVLFRILGVHEQEVKRVKEGSWNRILFIYGRPSDSEQVKAAEGMARFWSLAEQLVAARAAEPRDDFVSTLVHTPDVGGHRLPSEQSATVVLNLLFAGHETTTGLLGNMFNRLLATGRRGARSSRNLRSFRMRSKRFCGLIPPSSRGGAVPRRRPRSAA
jgi:cytochrome P450